MTQQPDWKTIANLGDANPCEHGGYFVHIDETGEYAPEGEWLEVSDEDNPKPYARVYRFSLEPCTFIDGILSDNKFHPGNPAWFADSLHQIATSNGCTFESLVYCLTSKSPIDRAHAWRDIGQYHGFENLDGYPLHLTKAETVDKFFHLGRTLNRSRAAHINYDK